MDQKDDSPPSQHTPEGNLTLAMNVAVGAPDGEVRLSDDPREPMEERTNQTDNLIGGGEYFEDDPNCVVHRQIPSDTQRVTEQYNTMLSRGSMFVSVVNQNLKRPARNCARNANRQSY